LLNLKYKLRILIVDNKDSFTYNLKHYINVYTDYVDVVRYDKLILNDVENYDKILLSPGPGTPRDYPILFDLLNRYVKTKSILGVCLGYQAIGIFFGGKLYNLDEPLHGVQTKLTHSNNCKLFTNLPLEFKVAHYHSWTLDQLDFPSDLKITSLNESKIIMSFKHLIYDVIGVQFHPESVISEYGRNIIKNWIEN